MRRIDGRQQRKTISELLARYRFEPSIRDLFVEGRSDAAVVKRFLRNLNLEHVVVYEVSTVEISPETVLASGQPDGVRGRIMCLALEFGKRLSQESKGATCVADRDYDLVLGRDYSSSFLLFLDYSCVEMYGFNEVVLDRLLNAIASGAGMSGQNVLRELETLLRRLFLIRATNISLGFHMKWLSSFSSSCTLSSGVVSFDEDDFIRRYLGKNSRLSDVDLFKTRLEELAVKTIGDARLFVRGHDFVHVLSWYLREQASGSSPLYRTEVLEQLLLAYIDSSDFAGEQFFKRLVERLRI